MYMLSSRGCMELVLPSMVVVSLYTRCQLYICAGIDYVVGGGPTTVLVVFFFGVCMVSSFSFS